jgi:hypothetical protein
VKFWQKLADIYMEGDENPGGQKNVKKGDDQIYV